MSRSAESGYTILETLIVMGITGSMLIIVSTAFGGRQQQVQFTQAVRDLQSRLSDIRNDIGTGYFSYNQNQRCMVTGNNSNIRPEFVAANDIALDEQGTSDECVSIGKVIQVSPDLNLSSDNSQFLNVYNVAGLRLSANGESPSNLDEARPTADPNPARILLEWGLKITKVITDESPTIQDRGAIAIFSNLSGSSGYTYSPTAEEVQINIIPDTSFSMAEDSFIEQINSLDDKVAAGLVDFTANPTITICVSDSDENRRAKIQLSSGQSDSILEFDDIGECLP